MVDVVNFTQTWHRTATVRTNWLLELKLFANNPSVWQPGDKWGFNLNVLITFSKCTALETSADKI